MDANLISELSSKGFWPAVAAEYFANKKYSRAVELCQLRLKDEPDVLSGRIVLARALYHSGQYELSEAQFYRILQSDPRNLVALKYLGDLKFREGEEATALSYYDAAQRIDPISSGLSSSLDEKYIESTRILTLRKKTEKSESSDDELREIPFKTETVGDLLLAQGHSRLAMEIYKELAEETQDPRLVEKLDKTQEILKNRGKGNV